MVLDSSVQHITRLTPLSTVLALIDRHVVPVAPQNAPVRSGERILATDIVAPELPARPIALRDGYAVDAAAIADASAYTPLPFLAVPARIDAGEALPPGTDAVAPLDAVAFRGDRAEAIAAVMPGEGVLSPGGDATPHEPLRRDGERLRAIDRAVLAAAGIESAAVRSPRICIARGNAACSPHIDAALDLVGHAVQACGGRTPDESGRGGRIEDALASSDIDAVIAVGGTGSGRHDASVQTLAGLGRVAVHGIAISPGETAAFGFAADEKPVLLVPGRLDGAIAAVLLVGRHLVARLAGARVEDLPVMLPLKRKVTSTVGLTELVPVRCAGGVAEPLASGYLSFQSLTRSDGWIVVAADSEGFAAGTPVAVNRWL
jgi:molybdopterin biosynthesis enzyme